MTCLSRDLDALRRARSAIILRKLTEQKGYRYHLGIAYNLRKGSFIPISVEKALVLLTQARVKGLNQ